MLDEEGRPRRVTDEPVLVRTGGRLALPDGATLLWTAADGRRGRRWRTVVLRDDAPEQSLLLEVDPAGRPGRLEITSGHGLLTLHPEPDEASIHGNVVDPSGVRPLAFGWGRDHELHVAGNPIVAAIACRPRGDRIMPGTAIDVDVIEIDADLGIHPAAALLRRLETGAWSLLGEHGGELSVAIDDAGLPAFGERWQLEA